MKKLTYKSSGVNIKAGYKVVSRIKNKIKTTYSKEVLGEIGAFSGFFKPNLKAYKEPVLVSSTDGVGTKVKIASSLGIHNTVGIDLVAMSVNDIITSGAKPLFFLDYIAMQKVVPAVAEELVKGIIIGCKTASCALLGGETAEMNDLYKKGEYDLAGFTVGVVEKKKIIDGSKIKSGQIIVGLPSSGPHSNGYSLIRKVFSTKQLKKDKTLVKKILAPTIIYVPEILNLIKKKVNISGIANITGGSFKENIGRILKSNQKAVIYKKNWKVPKIFKVIQEKGEINDNEMYNTFNMGIGMVIILSKNEIKKLKRPLIIGKITRGKKEVILK